MTPIEQLENKLKDLLRENEHSKRMIVEAQQQIERHEKFVAEYDQMIVAYQEAISLLGNKS